MTAFSDRVWVTSSSTGTGSFTLGAAVTGYQAFSTVFDVSTMQFPYVIESIDASSLPSGDWEVGLGYLSNATTLVRDIVVVSSNSNSLVNFSAGTSNVFNPFPAVSSINSMLSFNLQMGMP